MENKTQNTTGGSQVTPAQSSTTISSVSSAPESKTADVPTNISNKLSAQETLGAQKENSVASPETPLPVDISQLSHEQLQLLKSMLAATPDSMKRKKENPRISLRVINGNLVVDHKNAYLGLVKDHELNRDVERHIIPIRYLNSETFEPVIYKNFILSDRVVCEVVAFRNKVEEFVEGETTSMETGKKVEIIRKEVKTWFTIKLPEAFGGKEIEIEGRIANA